MFGQSTNTKYKINNYEKFINLIIYQIIINTYIGSTLLSQKSILGLKG